tara:strand:+ start:786 stop:944 length:159 start_codon:yes stop_codon:yes gene_type:complete
MKIRRVLDKKVGSKEYHKFLITLPKGVVKDSNLLNKNLKANVSKGKIIIEKD